MLRQSVRQKADTLYADRTSDITERISKRLRDHEQVLRGAAGLFNASNNVTRGEWRRYVSALQFDDHHPGILGLGFAKLLTPAEKEDHVRKVREEGFPEYQIRPDGDRSVYTSIVYLEPFNWRNQRAFGYDMYTEPVRRAAMERARDLGLPAIAGPITLVQETEVAKQRGILMYLPVYREGMLVDTVEHRNEALIGFVYSPIRMNDFVLGTLGHLPSDLAFDIFDGDPGNARLMFCSADAAGTALPRNYQPALSSMREVSAHGRTWKIAFRTLPPFESQFESDKAAMALWGGLTVTLLVTWITFSLQSTQQRALAVAKQMTSEFRESEHRFATMADSTPALLWMADRDRQCIWFNRSWLEFTGIPLDQSIGTGWTQAIHPDDRDRCLQAFCRDFPTGQPLRTEFRLRRADGQYRWILDTTVSRTNERGEFAGYIGTFTDITAVKQAENTIRQTEAFTRATIDSLPANICVLDENGTILTVNRRWREFADANPPAPELYGVGTNYLDICDRGGSAARRFAEGIRAVMRGSRDSYLQEYPCHSPREQRFYEGRVSRFIGGGPVRIVISHEDITERKRAESALKESRELLNAAQQQAHLGSWTRSAITSRVQWSDEMYRIFGIDPAQQAVKQFGDTPGSLPRTITLQGSAGVSPELFHSFQPAIAHEKHLECYTASGRAELDAAVQRALITGAPYQIELEILRSDGTRRTCIAKGEADRDELGRIIQLHGTMQDITELKSLTAELRKSHDLLNSLSAQVPGIIYQYHQFADGRHCFPYTSTAIQDLFGVSSEQVATDATPLFATVFPGDLDAVLQSIRTSGETLQPWRQEFRIIVPDRGPRWFEGYSQPVRLDDGSTLWHGFISDITERKRLENELELTSFSIDQIDDAVYRISPDARIVSANAACCRMLGYTQAGLAGMTIPDIDPHVDLIVWKQLWGTLMQSGRFRLESMQRKRDGSLIPVEVVATPITFEGQQYAIAVVRDIRERKDAETVRERLLLRQRAILDNLPMLAWLKDPEGRYEMVNNAFATALRTPAEAIIGRTPADILPPDVAAQDEVDTREVCASRQKKRCERLIHTRRSGARWFLQDRMPLFDEQGNLTGSTGVSQDITDSKAYEQGLEVAREAAEASNRAKSEFLANMSHEIRTPMNGILGMNQLLLATRLDERQRTYAEMIRSSADSLLIVLNDILDLSKIEARKLDVETTEFDLALVVEQSADLLALKAQQKGLEFVCSIEPDVPAQVSGDPARVRQMLLNLLGNAVKFTETGEVSLTVKVDRGWEVPAGQTAVRFEVRDTGIGIAPDKHSRIFQPFSQADTSTTRRYGGTGLGLSIVRGLVEKMGGRFGFESEEDKGSCFWFTLILRGHAAQSEPLPALAGRRLLVVESDSSGRRALMRLLAAWNCEVEAACTADAMLVCLRNTPSAFDAVLLDPELLLPGHAQLPKIPILALTPLASPIAPDQLGCLGYAAQISKPVKQSELRSCLAEVLGLRRAGEREDSGSRPVPAISHRNVRVLLVEDNPTNQVVALGMLENFGLRADAVADGRSALDALRERDYDIVLLDCQLPEMDGYEVARAIRDSETPVRNHAVHVIAMTAYALAGDRQKCLDAGMNDYIAKPVHFAELQRALEAWSAASSSLPVFDPVELTDRMMGNEDLARRVVATFLADTPAQLAALSDAVHRADADAARRAAHSIRGTAANAGGARLSDHARRLEELSASKDLLALAELVPTLDREFEAAHQAMAKFSPPSQPRTPETEPRA